MESEFDIKNSNGNKQKLTLFIYLSEHLLCCLCYELSIRIQSNVESGSRLQQEVKNT